ncbi:DoxX family protein [Microbacterium gorillae]|uniref:DoxX family protein n=1 Tax=Microbacterium gorillae TaxID=1231063 RepID=UPI003D953E82
MHTTSAMRLRSAARILLGTTLAVAGVSHLTFARSDFRAQVPDWVPLSKDTTVVASGVVEIALGAALVSGWKRRAVGAIVAAFFVAVFPGNVSQWKNKRDAFGLDTDRKRLLRLPFQIPLIGLALWSTSSRRRR